MVVRSITMSTINITIEWSSSLHNPHINYSSSGWFATLLLPPHWSWSGQEHLTSTLFQNKWFMTYVITTPLDSTPPPSPLMMIERCDAQGSSQNLSVSPCLEEAW